MNVLIFLIIVSVPCALSDLDKALDDKCTATKDCAVAYSVCDKSAKKCHCMKGFKAEGGLCVPPKTSASSCPTWNGAPGPRKIIKPCEWRFDHKNLTEVHTCQDYEICFLHPKTFKADAHYVYTGHCCPKPPEDAKNLTVPCPLTVNDPTGHCVDTSKLPLDVGLSIEQVGNCSYVTHECVRVHNTFACCPQPCIGVSSHFGADDGKCYDRASIGQPCTITAQCAAGSFCKAGKDKGHSTCQCKGKIKEGTPPYCDDWNS